MNDFEAVLGFEDIWRPPVGTRIVRPLAVLASKAVAQPVREKLTRVVAKAPEVMVKVTGRTRDPGHLAAHLSYITRNGELPASDRDGNEIRGGREIRQVAEDWSALAALDSRRRAGSPESVSMILSMPAGTDAVRLRDAAAGFAAEQFGDSHDYLLVLHTDTGHPHIHLSVRALGDHGERLNPKKADLDVWRQAFAEQLRLRGIAAEATPRRARGVTLKAERTAVRKIRERFANGRGELPRRLRDAYRDAAKTAFAGDTALRPWEAATVERQRRVRAAYHAGARQLLASRDPADAMLAQAVIRFVDQMPRFESQRLRLARELRLQNERLRSPPGSDRVR